MKECVFCGFKDKKVVVYEDKLCFVVVSTEPINKYHVMVIPKKHYENFVDLPNELTSHLFLIAKKMSLTVRKTCEPAAVHHIFDDDMDKQGYNLVPHFKIHIIPRFENDKIIMKWNRYDLTLKQRSDIAKEIKNNL